MFQLKNVYEDVRPDMDIPSGFGGGCFDLTSKLLSVAQEKDKSITLSRRQRISVNALSHDEFVLEKMFIKNKLNEIFPHANIEIRSDDRFYNHYGRTHDFFEYAITSDYKTLSEIWIGHLGVSSQEFDDVCKNNEIDAMTNSFSTYHFSLESKDISACLDMLGTLKKEVNTDDRSFQLGFTVSRKFPFMKQKLVIKMDGKNMYIDHIISSFSSFLRVSIK
jgi:hypothetical protein